MASVFCDGEKPDLGTDLCLIFMLSLSCLWFGVGLRRQLISDQVIFRRERRVGVLTAPYVGSKVIVLGILTALQAMFLSAAMYWVMPLTGEHAFSLPALLGVSALTAGWHEPRSLYFLAVASFRGRRRNSACADSADRIFLCDVCHP